MKVNVKLFGVLRNYVSGYDHNKGVDVVLEEGETIRNLLAALSLSENEARLFFVKGVSKKVTDPLNDGDEISVFLPIGGG